MLFPVLESVTGFDAEGMLQGKAAAFKAAGDGLSELAALMDMCGEALEDGILDNAEINAIIASAGDLPEAYDAIRIALLNGVVTE